MTRTELLKTVGKVGVKMACRAEPMGISTHVVMPVIRSALPALQTIPSQPQWDAVKSSIGTRLAEIEPVDVSSVINSASSVTFGFMNAFTQAQKEKEERAEHMMGPVVREVLSQTSEVLSAPLNVYFR